MKHHILYATDLGLYSPYVMKKLSRMAISMGAVVDILHVIEPIGVFAESILRSYLGDDERRYLHQYGLDKVLLSIKKQVEEALDNEYKEVLSGACVENVMVELGRPSQVIVETAADRQADLIVLGSHGQYSPNNAALGSVASKVVQTSHVPVLVIPMLDIEGLDRQT
ncbi:universal stress protein [Oceaniserpentilla sp. 4NH20-0058]|uniref:universal stress protein n=1 Tax=Oceaniserpentilla sp. 4NH20-0058 TaxID=3127660 RepID=UPI00310450D3